MQWRVQGARLFLMFGDAAQILKLFLGLDTNIIFYLPFSINSGINISDAHSEVKTMNIVHSTQEKRTIKVKDFLEYFRAGCTDTQLMEKFHLTPAGLDRFYGLLLERQILRSADFEGRTESTMEKEPERVAQDYEKPRFYCPSCLASQETLFDVCPDCGFDLHDSGRIRSAQGHPEGLENTNAHFCSTGANPNVAGLGCMEVKQDFSNFPGVEESGLALSPIEIPLKGPHEDDLFHHSEWDYDREVFGGDASEFKNLSSSFDDTVDHVVPGMPLEYPSPTANEAGQSDFRCLHCEDVLEPAVRNIFDRQGSRRAFVVATVFLILGLAGVFALTSLEGYSLLRLFVVYLTGTFMLSGSALMALGIFMLFLARELVYLCRRCGRTYPRA